MRQELDLRLEEMVPCKSTNLVYVHTVDDLTSLIHAVRVKTILFPDGMGVLVDPISSKECNAHLVGMILDSMVAAIMPDLVVGGR